MKSRARIIVLSAVGTTLFWIGVVVALFWLSASGNPGARVSFSPRPAELEVYSGAYRVEVVASNTVSASLLFSHTTRAPERMSFSVERLDSKTAQR